MFNAIKTSMKILNNLRIKYCFVGGYPAYVHMLKARKIPRAYRDIDILIPFDSELKSIHDALQDEGWEPFRSDPIHAFSDPVYRQKEFALGHCAACYSTSPFAKSDPIDLLLNFPPFEVMDVIDRAILFDGDIPLACIPDLIANKHIAAGDPKRIKKHAQDRADAAALQSILESVGRDQVGAGSRG